MEFTQAEIKNSMSVETIIKLDRFIPRNYQRKFCVAFEEGKYKKFLLCWCRRSGKDFTLFNLVLRAALRKIGSYFYCLPTFKQARLVIWDSITMDSVRFLDCIPKELIKKKHEQEMMIELVNGSMIRLIGSDTYDTSLVGTNPVMVVFSEYALADDRAYKYVRPILNANDGIVVVCSTPRGHNSFFDLYQIAKNHPEWYCEKLTLADTQHIPSESIQSEIKSGEISEELAQQEYFCSFELGIEGSYYCHYMDKMRLEGRISDIPWEPGFPVHVAFDLGMRDATAIIFFQCIGTVIHIIDYHENHSQGLEYYARFLQDKPYVYGKVIAPHDIQVRELGTGMSRLEKALSLGLRFTLAPNLLISDGIEAVRTMLPRTWIDEKKCARLIKCLENYRREFDSKRKIYHERPDHSEWSHGADAARYAAISLSKLGKDSAPEDLEKRYDEVMYGSDSKIPYPFRKPDY